MIRFGNKFRIAWWSGLAIVVTLIFVCRLRAIASGTAVPADFFLFLTWIALLLVPVFSEINFFGMSLKQDVRALAERVSDLQLELKNSVSVRTSISPVFNVSPPPDSELPALEQRLKATLTEVVREAGLDRTAVGGPAEEVPLGVDALFKARYQVEQELRRIWRGRLQGALERQPRSALQIARSLAEQGLLDQRVLGAVREVYAVASPAVHGEPVTAAQIAFVRDVAPQLIATLRAVS